MQLLYTHTYTYIYTHIYIVRCVSVCVSGFSCVQLFVTLQTVAHQAPLSMGFPRQECWNGLPCSPSGDLADPGIEPTFLMSPAFWQVLYHQHHPGSPSCSSLIFFKKFSSILQLTITFFLLLKFIYLKLFPRFIET